EVLINGHRLPIVGNICMDQLMVDITDFSDVAMGDCAVLLGKDGDQEISLDEMASKMGVINYEVLCRLGCRLPRIYYEK
ncbi:MAG: alanine racemase C-terminal domain-containing protein, partial [Clostridia bacterium]|nr:alanine racemase C-terminal domain-containing protein [Clostridia bacterium]